MKRVVCGCRGVGLGVGKLGLGVGVVGVKREAGVLKGDIVNP